MSIGSRDAKRLTKRLETIARDGLETSPSKSQLASVESEVETIRGTLFELFEGRKFSDNPPDMGESDYYFEEKLFALCNFVRIATGLDEREGYSDTQILSNVNQFAHLVERMSRQEP